MLLYLGNGDSDKEKRNDKSIKTLVFMCRKKKVLQRKNHYHKMDKDESLQDDLSKKLMKKILEAI